MSSHPAHSLQDDVNALLVLDLFDGLPGAGLNAELHDVTGDHLAAFAEHLDLTGSAASLAGNDDLAAGCADAAARCRIELSRRKDPRANPLVAAEIQAADDAAAARRESSYLRGL